MRNKDSDRKQRRRCCPAEIIEPLDVHMDGADNTEVQSPIFETESMGSTSISSASRCKRWSCGRHGCPICLKAVRPQFCKWYVCVLSWQVSYKIFVESLTLQPCADRDRAECSRTPTSPKSYSRHKLVGIAKSHILSQDNMENSFWSSACVESVRGPCCYIL